MYAFVYGTLKRNEPNNYWLTTEDNGSAKFIGTGKLGTKYPLVIASKYNIPFLLDKPGFGKEISGEIFEIDDKMLSNLDILEEYPKLYTRREEEVYLDTLNNSTNTVSIIRAWTYFLPRFTSDLFNRPHLDTYSSNGPHNLPYLARYLREKPVLATDFNNQIHHQ